MDAGLSGAVIQDMRRKLLQMGTFVVIGYLVFGSLVYLALGSTWQEAFVLPWWVLATFWFFSIVFLPRRMIYVVFLTLAVFNILGQLGLLTHVVVLYPVFWAAIACTFYFLPRLFIIMINNKPPKAS